MHVIAPRPLLVLLSCLLSWSTPAWATTFAVRDTLHLECPGPPPTDFQPVDLVGDPVTDRVIGCSGLDTRLMLLDPWTLEVESCADIGTGTSRLAIDAAARRLYALDRDGDSIIEVDADAFTVLDTLPAGPDPQSFALNAVTDKLYVSNYYHHTLTIVDAVGDSVIKTLAVGFHPGQPAASGSLNRIYVPIWPGSVAVVDGNLDVVEAELYVVGGICESELSWLNEARDWLYVSPFNCPLLTVIDAKTLEILTEDIWLPGYPSSIFGIESMDLAFVAAEMTLAVISPQHMVEQNLPMGSYHVTHGYAHPASQRLLVGGTIPPPTLDRAVLVIEPESSAIESDPSEQTPSVAGSLRASPNPFRRSLTLRWDLPAALPFRIAIFDATGRLIRTIDVSAAERSSSTHSGRAIWDGTDARGTPLPTGVYFYSLEHGRGTSSPAGSRTSMSGKVLLLR
jgi:DNA-binding beta-propeller fold protein YncE